MSRLTITVFMGCMVFAFSLMAGEVPTMTMEEEMDAAVREIASRHGNPDYGVFFTNDPELGESVGRFAPMIEDAGKLMAEIARLENTLAAREKALAEARSEIVALRGEVESLEQRRAQLETAAERFIELLERGRNEVESTLKTVSVGILEQEIAAKYYRSVPPAFPVARVRTDETRKSTNTDGVEIFDLLSTTQQ